MDIFIYNYHASITSNKTKNKFLALLNTKFLTKFPQLSQKMAFDS